MSSKLVLPVGKAPTIQSRSPASMGKPGYRPAVPPKPAMLSVVKPAYTESSPASRGMQPKAAVASGSISRPAPPSVPSPASGLSSPASQLRAVQQAASDPSLRKKIAQMQNPPSKAKSLASKISKKYGSFKRKLRYGFK